MKILITGAAGFVGKNLAAAFESVRDGKDKTHPALSVEEIYLYDIDSPASLLEEACCCQLRFPEIPVSHTQPQTRGLRVML